MLGSAIPRRWVVSLALVGLVSLFAASYSAVWANPASATTGPPPTSTPAPAGSVLVDLLIPGALNVQPGQVVGISASPIDDDGNVDLDMPGVIYFWNAGSCGTLSDTSSRTPVFTAFDSACTGSITVHAQQGGGSNVPIDDATIGVNVLSPPPPAVSSPIPDIPTVGQLNLLNSWLSTVVIVDASQAALVLPNAPAEINTGDEGSSLDIPAGSLPSGVGAVGVIETVDTATLPAAPTAATEGVSSGTFRFGSSAVQISFTDADGIPIRRLERPARVCVPFTTADLEGAWAGADGVKIWHNDGSNWRELSTSLTYNPNQACANTSAFSPFVLGLATEPPSEADGATGLPATGGYSPDAMTMILAMFAGFALVGTGVVAARRARRAGESS